MDEQKANSDGWNVNMPSNAFVFNIIQRNSYVPPTKVKQWANKCIR